MKSLASTDAAAAGPAFDLPVPARRRWDPRLYQIATLACLLGYGVCWLGLDVKRAARDDVTVTFRACYAALLVGRSLWLGEPLAIPLHRLESGALVLFAFFMISDPKTTPDSRAGRVLFAALVALGAHAVQ